MSAEAPGPGWIVATATTAIGILWAALRASDAKAVGRLEADLASERAEVARLDTLARHWERKALEYGAELKAAANRQRERDSLPPMRDEMPTMNAVMELRGDAPPNYREPPLNRIVETYSPTARPTLPAPIDPGPAAPPLSGVLVPAPRRPRDRRER